MGSINRDKRPLTNFCIKCNAWKGQLGLEPTFDLYIKHLCNIFDEVKRVLRKDGTCWVNMGDSYSNNSSYSSQGRQGYEKKEGMINHTTELEDKSLCNIPARFSIEMQNRGWILRNVLIWHKPNCMPSSVKDRFTVDFEYLFFFVKSKKYFFETQYEPHKWKEKDNLDLIGKECKMDGKFGCAINWKGRSRAERYGEFGRNKRTVWTITTKPFKESHFATYPEELCYTPIKAGCPEFVCNKCRKAREKIIEREGMSSSELMKGKDKSHWQSEQGQKQNMRDPREAYERQIINKGYSDCGCNIGFSGGIVLDPFFGSGTTGVVALKQNKNFIGIELNPEYIKIAEKRLEPWLKQTKLF